MWLEVVMQGVTGVKGEAVDVVGLVGKRNGNY